MTKIIKINKNSPKANLVEKAVAILQSGGVIAFPTDTVYGLGVDATNKYAVEKIYRIKKRDKKKPLIILAGRKKDAEKYAYLTNRVKRLMTKFWPGPLTIVLKAKKTIPKYLTRNGTIGLRMPENKIFISLALACKFPLATTSANLSGEASLTSAQGVAEKLGLPGEALAKTGDKIDLIIDGGRTQLRVSSTVVDMTCNKPKILRQGVITLNDITKAIS